jgi:TetR/AcrR family transcriptional repressor of nem operon
LKAAFKAGELPRKFDCDEVAAFLVSSLQGANLLAKAYRSPEPVERLKRTLFSTILR